ncbi:MULTISPECIES: phage tail protein [Photorhabdus]|uniref:Tail fiber protein n=2 Tax=Photorhabdus asymbiotica TaxID=291112 RepID=C7BSQ0_PHOAA|nr:phage tail protein [Photorhabdus asymbiotica]RKS66342.1 tail fiber-like repeat protein [Photorhabdus asymbiotica]CAQ83744.1 putative tail fiber protein [Photorhabdus asymbiotica]
MSAKNDFKAFSIKIGANVVSQSLYESSSELQTGLKPGSDIDIHLLNKTLRQSSTISSVIADFIATESDSDVLDDGNIAKLTVQLNKALEQKIATDIPSASLTQKGAVQLTNVIGNSDTLAVTQKLVQEIVNSLREYTDNRIKTANEVPVGSPIPWPLPHPPIGYFTCNGSAFNKSQYPKLAEAYPEGRLPDLRGEFIRGWDDSRGVDTNRSILSTQIDTMQNITGNINISTENTFSAYANGAFTNTPIPGTVVTSGYVTRNLMYVAFNSSRVVRTAHETRPRNIAFNYIVRAA